MFSKLLKLIRVSRTTRAEHDPSLPMHAVSQSVSQSLLILFPSSPFPSGLWFNFTVVFSPL